MQRILFLTINISLIIGILSEDNDELDDIEMTYSIMSFPNDVQLCLSSIPGHKFGVCSKEHMPAGTWIGPYEGNRVSPGALKREAVNSGFCWEVSYTKRLTFLLAEIYLFIYLTTLLLP